MQGSPEGSPRHRHSAEGLSPNRASTRTSHPIIAIFPSLPLTCLLFAITTTILDRRAKPWIIISFTLIVISLILTLAASVHYLRTVDIRHRHAHWFILLPLLLSFCAFALCIVPFRFFFREGDPPPKWFSALLTLPISLIAVVFALVTSFILRNDHRKHEAFGASSPH